MEENQVHIPDGWSEDSLGNILNYEQPYKYAVDTTEYNDKSGIPVLTAGKSFLLGYTNEVHNVYKNTPVIIFDDFTTDSKFVDFPFKVKSSAMKFLKPKNPDALDIKVIFGHIQNLKIRETGGDHKRRWISEFSKLKVALPPYTEQTQIATILSKVDEAISQTEQLIAKYTRIKTGLMQDLLTKGIDENGNIRSEETHEFKDSPLGRIPKQWECEKLERYGSFSKGSTISKSLLSDNGVNCILYGELYTKYDIYATEIFSKVPFEFVREKQPLKYGDILFAGSGETHEDIGKCITFIGNKPTYAGGDIVIFRSKHFNPIFLSMLLNSFKLNIQKSALGQGSSVIHIYPNHLKMLEVIFPDEVEQDRIAEIILKNEMYINDLETNLSKLQSLKTGLMQDLLSGKVRVNHLIKETANV